MGPKDLSAVILFLAILIAPGWCQRRSRLATGAGQPVEFDCPEEFGYYPHPSDCTQYYVCVFGGALLESCTGGLMYSHELQTCDWPRNVGCSGGGESATISTVRVTDPRTRQTTPTAQGPSRSPLQVTRDQAQQQRQQQEEIAKHQLYADDLGPAEEIESDRQQRVYRGQPSTVGQVARDRDGLRHQPVTNSIPATRSSSADKVAVISFGSQQQTQNTQYSLDPLTEDNFLTNETARRRKKRQTRFRYPARIVQIVPSGARPGPPWPNPPSPSVHGSGNGGNFKYQGNSNRNKPPRLTDPINTPETGFQQVLNPNISPTDIRNVHSPEQYSNSKLRPLPNSKFSNPDSHYGHRPPINSEPEVNVRHYSNTNKRPQSNYNSANNKPHSGGASSPAHSIIIPSSYATFQNLPGTPLQAQNNSFITNLPQASSGAFQNANNDDDDAFSYFHLENTDSQSAHHSTTPSIPLFSAAPTLSNLLSSLKNAEILAGQNQQANAGNLNSFNDLQFLKSLTSLHEIPYNSDGTRQFPIQPQHHPHQQQDIALNNNNFNPPDLIHHLVSQPNHNFPALNNFASTPNNLPSTHAGHQSVTPVTTQAPFTPIANPYGIKYKKEPKPQDNTQQEYENNRTPHRFAAKPPLEYEEHHSNKQVRQNGDFSARPSQESSTRPSSEYSSSEEDYYDDSTEDSVRSQLPSSHFYESSSKYKPYENPFANVNFDFDKYIDKLRGGYHTSVTHSPPKQKEKERVPVTYEKPDDYDDYSDEEYDDYEDSEEQQQPPVSSKPAHQHELPVQKPSLQSTRFQGSTEANIYLSKVVNETKYRLPSKTLDAASTSAPQNIKINPGFQQKVPETLTVPFFPGPDGNFYSRPQVNVELKKPEASTAHPFPVSESTTNPPTTHKELFKTNTKTTIGPPVYRQSGRGTADISLTRETDNVPSRKPYAEFPHFAKQATTTTTTTYKPLVRHRPISNHQNNGNEPYEDYVYSTGKNIGLGSQPNKSLETTHIHLLPTNPYHNNGYVKQTSTTTTIRTTTGYGTSLAESDSGEFATSTSSYPYKATNGPLQNFHYITVPQSTAATFTTESSGFVHHSARGRHKQPAVFLGGSKYNNSEYSEGANIFSSVKDTIFMMSNNNSELSGSNSNQRYPGRITSSHSTTQSPETHTTQHAYTVRRRPSKERSTTPRYRARKPTTPPPPFEGSNLGNQPSLSLPRPETTNTRPHRRPGTKSRYRTTTPKVMTSTDGDSSSSTDKPKLIRLNKKLAPDKEGSRTTNNIRVDPSPAPVSYVRQPALQASPSPPTYNNSQQYDNSQYDPYYSLYDEDVELYRDVADYTQYTSNQGQTSNNQQYRGQSPYKQAPVQPEVQAQRNNAYAQPTYNTQDVYSQAVGAQDYNENYNAQLANDQYRQTIIQSTKAPSRGSSLSRNRGNPAYTVSTASDTVNRGTPASVRSRPTLKPSTAIVPKSQEFVDIYRFPPGRPDPIYPTPQVDKTAAKCRKDVCLLPDCYCGGKEIPGGYAPEEIPQIVLLTFDDSANDLNKGLYSDLFETGRKNPNGCPISATFYVSHEWTDYSHVQNLYAGGHEIASHSISHSFGEQFSQKKWTKEIAGQREILAAYGGVKLEDVRGMRAPFLAIGGNKMFKMLYDSNFTYDSSMPVYENRPPSWPYTLDYKIFHDCMIPPCPTRSYPGVWEVPMVMWQDLNGGRCSMGDACSNPPTADGVYKMLIKNFERHYTTNRAPFGLFYHAAWFTQPHHKEGFEAFLDTIVSMPDVWLVTNWQALQWIRDPTPMSRINSFQPWQCNYPDRPKKCNNPKVCNLWHKSGVRYMRTCQPCPDIYPWTGKTGVRNSRVDNEVIEE